MEATMFRKKLFYKIDKMDFNPAQRFWSLKKKGIWRQISKNRLRQTVYFFFYKKVFKLHLKFNYFYIERMIFKNSFMF